MVEIVKSSDDLLIYNNDKNLRIYAGPGAGKTHLLIENIKAIVKNSLKMKNSSRKILCITYTNAGADEIKERLGSYNQYVFVSTIHAFINEYIIKQNQIQLKYIIEQEFNIKIDQSSKITSVLEGYNTLSGKKREEIFEYISKKYPNIDANIVNNLSRKKMIDIQVDITEINSRKAIIEKKNHITYDVKKMDKQLALAIKNFTWNVAGKLSFDEILYFGYKILEEYPLALHLIQVEFPYILLDEYQDTNPIQNKIVRMISEKECVIGVVGDIAQSIYSFQGACYEEFKYFSLNSSMPIKDYVIKGNRRSTQNIINFINFIRKTDNELNDQTCEENKDNNELVTFIIQHDKRQPIKPLDSIIKPNTRILCRKWSEAFKYIEGISTQQNKLLNDINNVYTYRLNKNFETEVEAKKEIWVKTIIDIIELEEAFKRKCVPSMTNILDKYYNFTSIMSEFNDDNDATLVRFFKFLKEIFTTLNDSILIKDLVDDINYKIDKYELSFTEKFKYPLTGSDDYFEPIYELIDKLEYKTAKRIVKDIFSEDSKYMTIHKSKGREFDSVLVNIEPFQRGEEKTFLPYKVICNPVVFKDNHVQSSEVYGEYTRIIYVAFSRAINKLYVHLFGDKIIEVEIDRTLGEYCREKGLKKFYNFEHC